MLSNSAKISPVQLLIILKMNNFRIIGNIKAECRKKQYKNKGILKCLSNVVNGREVRTLAEIQRSAY